MVFELGNRSRLAGCRLTNVETADSTNALALDAGRNGDIGRHWFTAIEQTGGRGRRGRVWQSQKGNLHASLLLVFDDIGDHSGLGFVAGVALAEALNQLAPGADFKLKWPNDLLLDGKKLSGILLEALPLSQGKQAVVVGIGVNVVAAPKNLDYPATSLLENGIAVTAPDLFRVLTERFAETFVIWRHGHGRGLEEVLKEWRRHAAGLGGPIAVATPTGPVEGIFEALDETGRLMVRTANGEIVTISAGDVHFGSVASIGA